MPRSGQIMEHKSSTAAVAADDFFLHDDDDDLPIEMGPDDSEFSDDEDSVGLVAKAKILSGTKISKKLPKQLAAKMLKVKGKPNPRNRMGQHESSAAAVATDDFFLHDDNDDDLPIEMGPDDSEFSDDEEVPAVAPKAKLGQGKGVSKNLPKQLAVKKPKVKGKPKPRNRMGQRERRRLAETKFGKNAKHVKKPIAQVPANDRRQRSSDRSPGKPAPAFRPAKRREEVRRDADAGKPEKLHPSWAAKVAQAKMIAMPGVGKKIKFDED